MKIFNKIVTSFFIVFSIIVIPYEYSIYTVNNYCGSMFTIFSGIYSAFLYYFFFSLMCICIFNFLEFNLLHIVFVYIFFLITTSITPFVYSNANNSFLVNREFFSFFYILIPSCIYVFLFLIFNKFREYVKTTKRLSILLLYIFCFFNIILFFCVITLKLNT